MLVKTKYIPKGIDALSIWPITFIRPEKSHDKYLIEHERLICRAQRNTGVLPWLLLYWLSSSYRLKTELRLYHIQIEAEKLSIGSAAYKLTRRGLDMSYVRMVKLLRAYVKESK